MKSISIFIIYFQLKSKELVQAYIDRIREVNPHINAVVEERFEEALKDAERADDLLNKCPLDQTHALFARYPILGIPFTVKEACGLKGKNKEFLKKHQTNKFLSLNRNVSCYW